MRNEVVESLQMMADHYGVGITAPGGSRFTADHMTLKLEIAVIRDGEAVTKESADGISAAALGSKYTRTNGDEYEIIGWHAKNRKYPIIVVQLRNDRKWKVSVSFVIGALDKADRGESI